MRRDCCDRATVAIIKLKRRRLALTGLNGRVRIDTILTVGIDKARVAVISVAADLERYLRQARLRVISEFLDRAYGVGTRWRSLRPFDKSVVEVVLRSRSETT